MLNKLIKYDFKAMNRYLIPVHIMLLITALLGRVLFVDRFLKNAESLTSVGEAALVIGVLLIVIIFMAAVFGTLALVGIYFYKNLFSDEGYLTQTLPVSRGKLLTSKTITGSLWIFVDETLVTFSVFFLIGGKVMKEIFINHRNEMWELMGIPGEVGYGIIILSIVVLFVVSAIANAATLYLSVVLGQLFSNHRVLGAVVVYFCINTVISIISSIVGATTGTMSMVVENGSGITFSMYNFCIKLFVMGAGLEAAIAVISCIVTYILMNRKLNMN